MVWIISSSCRQLDLKAEGQSRFPGGRLAGFAGRDDDLTAPNKKGNPARHEQKVGLLDVSTLLVKLMPSLTVKFVRVVRRRLCLGE